ncbi:MAG: TonB-dependent receptor, partial [Bacteroidetes bacterium]|nr:TonB-dependent receptor [Bacteroidota bacterium]
MRNSSILLLALFHILPLSAKILTVKDKASNKPLEYAIVYNTQNHQNASTNFKGQVDIFALLTADSLGISLLGFQTTIYSMAQLQEMNFMVFLQPSQLSLDEVIISATRWQQERRETPSKITKIQKKDVLLQNPQTAADLLNISGEVFIQKSQQGGGNPMIRGFATNRVLLTVDGVRMNNAIFRSGNIQNVISIDPLAIEKTEVLFGPGAVMYGSDAIGGAMNFYTLSPIFSTDKKASVSGNAISRYSTANNEKTGHFDINFGFKKWAFLSSATFSDFGDLKTGSHGPEEFLRPEFATRINGRDTVISNADPRLQVSTGYSQLNLMQKVRFAPNKKWDFQYGLHYSATSDVPRYDRLLEYRNEKLRDAEWYYGPQEWLMNTLNISHRASNRLYNQIRITLAHQYFRESRHNRSFNSNNRFHREEQVDAFSLNIDFEKKLNKKRSLLYGAEGISNFIGSFAESENIKTGAVSAANTRYPNGSSWHSMGLYLNYIQKIREKTTIQSGIRYSHILINAPFDTSIFPLPFTAASVNTGAVTGSIGMAHRATPLLQINANLSTGFRAPNIDDIGKVFDSEPGAVIVPNPNLKPEYAYNAELGISRVFTNFLKFDLSAYYTLLDNALVRREFSLNGADNIIYEGELSKVLAIQNAASAKVYGLQAGVEIKLIKGFAIISRFTYQTGAEELDEGGTASLRHAVPWFG